MTSPHSERKGSRARSKSKLDKFPIEIHLLYCGHGDTILIRLSGDKWVLVDCHLPAGPIRRQFFEFVETHGIRRLDLLCLTHPHRDHFEGMLEVVQYFTASDRSIGFYCDSGVDPVQVRDILVAENRPASEVSDYAELHHRLDGLIDKGTLQYYRADANGAPIRIKGDHGVQFVPMGPDPAVVRRMIREALRSGEVRGSVNQLSLILLLQVRSNDVSLDALLAGDAEPASLSRALEGFGQGSQTESGRLELDIVKVPHHGSAKSHCANLCGAKRNSDRAIAAISAGTRRALPDREVMREYADAGWTVLVTTKRFGLRRKDSPLTLSGVAKRDQYSVDTHNIHICWDKNSGLAWEPVAAFVSPQELEFYDSTLPAPNRLAPR